MVAGWAALALPVAAAPLSVAELQGLPAAGGGPAVEERRIEVTLPGTLGRGELLSRAVAPAGSPEGPWIYLYRLDLRRLTGATARPCVDRLSLDFGANERLDYDGDGRLDDAFVVLEGAGGAAVPRAVERRGGRLDVQFRPSVCPGLRPGTGAVSVLVGFAATGPPQAGDAELGVLPGSPVRVAVLAPRPARRPPVPAVPALVAPPGEPPP